MEEIKKCKRCSFVGPLSSFIGKSGKILIACQRCIKKNSKAREALLTKRKIAAMEKDLRWCNECRSELPLSHFNRKENGEIITICNQCSDKIKPKRADYRKRIRESDQYEQFKETKNKKNKEYVAKKRLDPLWNKHRAKQSAEYRLNNPEKTKYYQYKTDAAIRKLEFYLSYEEAYSFFHSPCFYCSVYDPNNSNGIDRFNNSDCYTVENCRSCCTMCNVMKLDWDYEAFISIIGHILAYNNRNGQLAFERLCDSKRGTFSEYKFRAEKRGYIFKLSKYEFKKITSEKCYLCGHENSPTHLNGVDRLVNSVGYEYSNCRACCKMCNHLKNAHSIDDLLAKFEAIYKIHGDINRATGPFKRNKIA